MPIRGAAVGTISDVCGGILSKVFGGGDVTAKADLISDAKVNSRVDVSKRVGAGLTKKIKGNGTTFVNNGTINIHQHAMSEEDRESLKKEILDEFNDGKLQLVAREPDDELCAFNEYNKGSSRKYDEVEFFHEKIPPSDWYLLQVAFYIKYLFEIGDVDRALRTMESATRGNQRARNIINLASAGYFNDYIRPIFESGDRQDALDEYNYIVNFLPEIVFVSSNMEAYEIVRKIEDKFAQRKKNHAPAKKVTVNGIGHRCLELINKADKIIREKRLDVDSEVQTFSRNGIVRTKMQILLKEG